MTSKIKCPFCQQELHKDPDGYYSCYTDNCSVMSAGGNGAGGTESLWTALTQAKQDLEIARKALEELNCEYNHCRDEEFEGADIDWEWWAMAAKNVAEKALETIEHKEI